MVLPCFRIKPHSYFTNPNFQAWRRAFSSRATPFLTPIMAQDPRYNKSAQMELVCENFTQRHVFLWDNSLSENLPLGLKIGDFLFQSYHRFLRGERSMIEPQVMEKFWTFQRNLRNFAPLREVAKMETHGEKTSLLLVIFEGVCLTQPSGIFENCTTKIVDLKSKKQNELRIF